MSTPPQNLPSLDASEKPEDKHYRLAIRRPVTTAMIFLTLVIFGWQSYERLPINLMPDISYPTLTVRTEYEGAAPEDVEKLVTRPLEEQLSLVGGLVEISSVSSAGRSDITLEFTWDTDMNLAQQEVRDQLDLFEPPREVTEQPIILRYDPTLDPVMRIAIAGPEYDGIEDPAIRLERQQQDLLEIREAAERQLKSDLEGQMGIAQVNVKGGREKEVQVYVDGAQLKNIGLSLETVASQLAQQNINLSGGSLRDGNTEFLVRTLNEFESVEEIRDALITTQDGRQVRLRDVSRVRMGEKERETIVRLNGREAVELEIFKEGDANTVAVCQNLKDLFDFERELGFVERVQQRLAEARAENAEEAVAAGGPVTMQMGRGEALRRTLRSRLPEGSGLTLISDQSRFITASIEEVQRTAIVGGFLALIILFFFLRRIQPTIIIGVAIPISVVATFIPMFMWDISLNIMSLGGLALGIGMLVDNSIVVLESIFRCQEEGDGTKDAAERGTREVGSAVTASTLTTIAVFLPIAFVEGVAGQLFSDQALTVTFSLIASLIAALYFIPMVSSREKLAFVAPGDAVWLVQAYRNARADGKRGRAGALIDVPAQSVRMAYAKMRETAKEVFAIYYESAGNGRGNFAYVALAPLLPVLAVIFVLYCAVQLTLAFGVTALFAVSMLILAVVSAIGLVLKGILWGPLKIFDVAFSAIRSSYRVLLSNALHISPVLLAIVLVIAGHAFYTANELGRELIPPLRQGEFGIRMETPPGTRLQETERRAAQIEAIAASIPEVGAVAVEVGQEDSKASGEGGENVATFTVTLEDPDVNAQQQDAVIEELRQRLAREVSLSGITFTLPALFSFKTAIELQIRGDNLDRLREVGQNALAAISGVPGLKDAELSVKAGYPEILIELDRELLASKGLTPQQVATRLRTELQGDVPSQFNQEGNRIDMRVRADEQYLTSVSDLRDLSVVDGYPPVPLRTVAAISVKEGPSEIRRIDQRQVALITGNVEGRDLAAVSEDISRRLSTVDRPEDYVFVLGGQNREMETSLNSLRFALLLAVFLVYVVMASQFESIWHPALVMFSVPLAFIGVVYVLDWLDLNLSIVVFIGGIILAGIVVNNAIVLVDYINQLRARGMKKRDAVIEAGCVRLRPILMTTLTTVLGLIPMAVYAGSGAEIRQPMAVTVMAGLMSSTLLTLFIIPMIYDLLGGRDPEHLRGDDGGAKPEGASA